MIYYKAVAPNLKSLGLKRAKPIQYRLNRWVYPREKPDYGEFTAGGLWVGKNKSFINWIRKYMREKYGRRILIYTCEIGGVLFETCNRVKTDKVRLVALARESGGWAKSEFGMKGGG